MRAPVLPTYARQDITFVAGEGAWLVDAEGRRYLDFLAGIAVVGLGHLPPRPARGRAVAARAPLARLEPLLDRADGRARRLPVGPLRRCARVLLQLGRGGDRGCAQVRTQGDREARASSRSRARSTAARFGALAATGQPPKRAPFEPLVPGITLRRAERRRLARRRRRRGNGLHPARARAGRRRDPAPRRRPSSPRPARSRTSSARCSSSTRSRPAWAAPARSSASSSSAFGRTRSRSRKGSRTASRSAACWSPTTRPARSSPATTARPSAGTPSSAAAAVAVCETIDDTLLTAVRATGSLLAEGLAELPGVVEVRGLGLLLGAELDRPAAGVVDAVLRARPGRRLGGRERVAARHRRSRSARPRWTRRSRSSRRCSRNGQVRAPGRDHAARPGAAALDAGRARGSAARDRHRGRPDHRLARHRATRPRQGARTTRAGSSMRCRAPKTSTG